jgi:hypothetical protein
MLRVVSLIVSSEEPKRRIRTAWEVGQLELLSKHVESSVLASLLYLIAHAPDVPGAQPCENYFIKILMATEEVTSSNLGEVIAVDHSELFLPRFFGQILMRQLGPESFTNHARFR